MESFPKSIIRLGLSTADKAPPHLPDLPHEYNDGYLFLRACSP